MLSKHKTTRNIADFGFSKQRSMFSVCKAWNVKKHCLTLFLASDRCFAIKIVFATASAVSSKQDRSCIHDRLFKFFRIQWRVASDIFFTFTIKFFSSKSRFSWIGVLARTRSELTERFEQFFYSRFLAEFRNQENSQKGGKWNLATDKKKRQSIGHLDMKESENKCKVSWKRRKVREKKVKIHVCAYFIEISLNAK